MKRLLVAAALAASLGLAASAAADMADADALYGSGRFEEAFAAYAEQASDQNGMAMLRMAQMFEAGEGVAASRTRALTWYRRAAAHDVPEAHFRIGQMYETGIGVPRNYAEAVRAYREAADLGHAGGLIALANLYADGSGAMPDTSEAARLLKQAADSGNTQAGAALERLVASGTVPRDVLDDLGIPPPPPPVLPTVEELAAQGIAAQEGGSTSAPATSQAPAIAESEAAAQVRANLESAIAGFTDTDAARLDYTIDIAEHDDGAMEATIRGLRVVSPDVTWKIGDIVYVLTPVEAWTYDAAISWPATTTIHDAQGMAIGGSTLASQTIGGTWNIALNIWPRSRLDLQGLTFTLAPPDQDPVTMTIAAATAEGTLEAQADGRWGGPTHAAIEDLQLDFGGGQTGGLARINLTIEQRAIDYVFFQAMALARAEFEGRFGATPDLGDPAAQAAMQEMVRPLLALARERAPLVGDLAFDLEMLGLTATDPEAGAPFAVDRIHLAMGARGLDAAAGVVDLVYEHSGFAAALDGAAQRYLPAEVSFVVALRNLPVEDTGTMSLEMLEGAVDDLAAFQDNGMMALTFLGMGLQQSMATSGSTLDIERIAYLSPGLKAAMTGELVATTQSPLGAVGTVTLEIEGLDAAVAELSAMAEDPDAQEMAMPLAMLQAMGERVEDAGTVRHVYLVELTPDGRTLLNGNDMGPMMEGMMGGDGSTY